MVLVSKRVLQRYFCSLFNDAIINLYWMILINGLWGCGCGIIFLLFCDMYGGTVRKTMKNLGRNSWCPSRDSDQDISYYNSATLPLETICSVHTLLKANLRAYLSSKHVSIYLAFIDTWMTYWKILAILHTLSPRTFCVPLYLKRKH
jgi:hypothetical protein